ncbi:hypothetical protein NA56DRAFT_720319 [Hyaloscypha hepaticicola]|uniref:Uncharacterized protein n=1 Tax=Hyaloscypha hepaticicola TaxID=2082293 RepID=A0A2J6Q4Z0_9HELO|nr:hypothetical protein NA56DRAFT_720319 [Hyaloscypha hepaticicola]
MQLSEAEVENVGITSNLLSKAESHLGSEMWRDLKIYFFYIQRLSVHFNQQLISRRQSVSQLRTLLRNHPFERDNERIPSLQVKYCNTSSVSTFLSFRENRRWKGRLQIPMGWTGREGT